MPSEAPAASDAASVLARAPIAFFCSKACPGDIILKAQDWANAREPESAAVIGGFQSDAAYDFVYVDQESFEKFSSKALWLQGVDSSCGRIPRA